MQPDRTAFDPEQFIRDIETSAALVDAPFSGPVTRDTVTAFQPQLSRHALQIKTTSKPNRRLYYRFFIDDRDTIDVDEIAARARLPPESRDAVRLLGAAHALAAVDGRLVGCDFDAACGLAKVWIFVAGTPLTAVLDLAGLPASVRAHGPLFARYGLDNVRFLATDFDTGTVNLYFRRPAAGLARWVPALLNETGTAAGPDTVAAIERTVPSECCVAMTFAWARPELVRWSMYALDVGPGGAAGEPPLVPEVLARFRDRAPTLNRDAQINIAWSFGSGGLYMKLEKSYARDVRRVLRDQMKCLFSPTGSAPARREAV